MKTFGGEGKEEFRYLAWAPGCLGEPFPEGEAWQEQVWEVLARSALRGSMGSVCDSSRPLDIRVLGSRERTRLETAPKSPNCIYSHGQGA